jgi:hypothetical protein
VNVKAHTVLPTVVQTACKVHESYQFSLLSLQTRPNCPLCDDPALSPEHSSPREVYLLSFNSVKPPLRSLAYFNFDRSPEVGPYSKLKEALAKYVPDSLHGTVVFFLSLIFTHRSPSGTSFRDTAQPGFLGGLPPRISPPAQSN